MYKAVKEIKVTFDNNKTTNITLTVFDNAIDNTERKLAKEVKHYADNPHTVKVNTIYEHTEWF